MLMMKQRRGDTIVEVMFAVAVFSLVAVVTVVLMNLGTNNTLRSVETTAARQAIDGQVAALQLMHDSYIAQYKAGATTYTGAGKNWYDGIATGSPAPLITTGTTTSVIGKSTCPNPPSTAFVLDPKMNATGDSYHKTATYLKPAGSTSDLPYPQYVYTSAGAFSYATGIWVQAKQTLASGKTPGYVDFYINACWPDPAGNSTGVMTIGTIVRLYVPA